MNDLPKRKIEELVALYQLNPRVSDIFVEGETDRDLIGWYFDAINKKDVSVNEISTIEIPVEWGGNKEKVIRLARELCKELPDRAYRVLCVVDKDIDEYTRALRQYKYLMYTDFACMEGFFLTRQKFRKFCRLYFGDELLLAGRRWTEFVQILQTVFMIRVVKTKVMEDSRWITFSRCCKINGVSMRLNQEEFCRRLLLANGELKRKTEFLHEVDTLVKATNGDYRNRIHGHDMLELLSWYAKKRGKNRWLYNVDKLHRSLMASVEEADLADTILFKKLASI